MLCTIIHRTCQSSMPGVLRLVSVFFRDKNSMRCIVLVLQCYMSRSCRFHAVHKPCTSAPLVCVRCSLTTTKQHALRCHVSMSGVLLTQQPSVQSVRTSPTGNKQPRTGSCVVLGHKLSALHSPCTQVLCVDVRCSMTRKFSVHSCGYIRGTLTTTAQHAEQHHRSRNKQPGTDTDVLSDQRYYEQTLHSKPWVYAQSFVITTLSMQSGAMCLCQVYSDYNSPACKAASAHWERTAKDW